MDPKWETGVGGDTDLESCQLMGTVFLRSGLVITVIILLAVLFLSLLASSTESRIYGQSRKSLNLVEQVDEAEFCNEFAEKGVGALLSVIDL